MRGLSWKEPLELRLVSRAEMVRRLQAANARDAVPAHVAAEEATLEFLGLIPAELDYGRLIDEILRAAVLGFYDPETKELYVAVGDANALDAAEKATIVHEMTHALTDQHFAYGPRTIALDKADRADEALALSALIEGDARLTELQWMTRSLTEVEALAVLLGAGAEVGEDVSVLSRTPSYVRRALVFPYEEGRKFVERLHATGGFAAVDAAYGRPPASTEHVLHPEAYTAAESARPPALPDVAAATGCRRIRSGTLGEFDMRAVLDQHAPGAATAAEGWNGDSYSLLRCGAAPGLVQRWEADSAAEAGRLADALNRWSGAWSGGSGPGADGRFTGPSGAGRIVRNGARVDLVAARDAATAERLQRALRPPERESGAGEESHQAGSPPTHRDPAASEPLLRPRCTPGRFCTARPSGLDGSTPAEDHHAAGPAAPAASTVRRQPARRREGRRRQLRRARAARRPPAAAAVVGGPYPPPVEPLAGAAPAARCRRMSAMARVRSRRPSGTGAST